MRKWTFLHPSLLRLLHPLTFLPSPKLQLQLLSLLNRNLFQHLRNLFSLPPLLEKKRRTFLHPSLLLPLPLLIFLPFQKLQPQLLSPLNRKLSLLLPLNYLFLPVLIWVPCPHPLLHLKNPAFLSLRPLLLHQQLGLFPLSPH
jgi:hypothetical protein